jgi:hypothetical protein
MAKSFPLPMPDHVLTIFVQICGAFAQGADGCFVDDEVILQARQDYVPLIKRTYKEWASIGPFTLALTKAMGKMAAVRALTDGEVTVRKRHYEQARQTIHSGPRICPSHHHIGKK